MSDNDETDWSSFEVATRAVRAGVHRTDEGEHSEAIHLTSSYVFDSAAAAAARFSGDEPGNIYSRFTNPTVRSFEQRLAAMDGGDCCVATSTGMSAILAVCMGMLKAGDHVVAGRDLFGSTIVLFNNILTRFGLEFSFVDTTDNAAWRAAVRPETRMLFVESPSNPLCAIADIAAVAQIAHEVDAVLVVDNTYSTPVLQRPLELGADIVVYSSTKHIDGQGRTLGGAVVGSHKHVGESIFGFLRSAGPSMSPFNAWVQLKGLETLAVRMKAHSDAALVLANWLEDHDAVERVYYTALPSHAQYELAHRQQSAAGGVLSFEVKGGREQAWHVIDSTRMISITANLGDTRTTITHPATTTHGRLSPQERLEMGIADNLVRLSVGLEGIEDIKADLQRGLGSLI